MRILQISEGFVGAQKDIETAIHEYLKSHGYESVILYAVGTVPTGERGIIAFEKKPDNLIRRALWKYAGHSDKYAYLQTRRMIQKIKEFGPDIVHIHVIHHGFVDFSMLMDFLNRREIKIVYTLHDLWAVTGGCYHYTDVNCAGYLRSCAGCTRKEQELDCRPEHTERAFVLKRQKFSQAADIRFVAVSDWLKREAEQALGQRFPVTTIYNGVPLIEESQIREKDSHPLIEKMITERCGRTVLVGCAADWNSSKGIERFFELARLLGPAYWIVLVGSASREIMENSPENITYLGYVSDRALMWDIYQHADLHVSMSLEETFGMTFVEAAMNGIRSVGFHSTAIPEIVSAAHGIVVEAGNVMEMLKAIKSKEKWEFKLSEVEKNEVRNHFSSYNMAEAYTEEYCHMVAANSFPFK